MSGVEARDRKSQPQGKKILHKQEHGQELGKDGDHIVRVCFNLIDFDKKWFEYHRYLTAFHVCSVRIIIS